MYSMKRLIVMKRSPLSMLLLLSNYTTKLVFIQSVLSSVANKCSLFYYNKRFIDFFVKNDKYPKTIRPRLHEYVFIENDIAFNENAMIVLQSTHRFRIVFVLYSLETVFESYRFQSFSCRCKVKTQRQVSSFDENDMKMYSCSRGLRL